ncbi:hypothetical protein [Nocardia sp. NPDC057353]|uniref:hypothetical protein n=1 Tax=Nocardia sp. NPDC057353 TaxID=3346104 RepID=UPI00363CC6CA
MGSVVSVWDLDADLGQLEAFETAWKAQVEKLSWAADTMTRAAGRVIGGGEWDSPAADRYDAHRRKLVADLDDCAETAGAVAGALRGCIDVLRFNQGLLDDARAAVASRVRCTVTGVDGRVDLFPEDDEQVELANGLVSTYTQIRSRVDGKLDGSIAVLRSAMDKLDGWSDAWSGRTLRMLNYNIQQGGGGNRMPLPPAFRYDDIRGLAQRLQIGDIDIATLQEVFRDDAQVLQNELNAHAAPGEKWEVNFGQGSNKANLEGPWKTNDFGNVVVVRTRDGVSATGTSVTDLGPGDEGRSVIEVEVELE